MVAKDRVVGEIALCEYTVPGLAVGRALQGGCLV